MRTTLAIAATLLLAACNNDQTATTSTVNTTEVTPTESESGSVSDSMVTNIDAAAPTGGAEENAAEPVGNAL